MNRPTHTPAWAVGMQKLAQGFYADGTGALHIDEREICAAAGVPYTKENAETIAKTTIDIFREFATAARKPAPVVIKVEEPR